jgi:phosphoglycerate dehydrogenase-like enzyme
MPSILVTRPLPSAVVAKLQNAGTVDVYTDGAMPADVLKQRVVAADALVSMFTDDVNKSVIDAAANAVRQPGGGCTILTSLRVRVASSALGTC